MKIAFDAKRALHNTTGLGNYSRQLLLGLKENFPTNTYDLFSPTTPHDLFQNFAQQFPLHYPQGSWKALPALWRSYQVANEIKADIFHGLSNELPFVKNTRHKKVVTIHDLIFLKHYEQYPFFDRKIYETKTRWACAHADMVVATSEETKRDVMQFYKTPESKIEVVYQGCNADFFEKKTTEEKEQVRRKYALPQQFILNISSFFARKNQTNLIRAFELAADKIEQDLVLVGNSGNLKSAIKAQIKKSKFRNRIQLLALDSGDIPTLYQLASLFVYPSFFEGFGIQLAEAMASGTPLVASDIACFREVANASAVYCNPNSSNDLAEKIMEQLQQKPTLAVQAQAAFFSTKNVAERMMRVYELL